MTIDGIILSCIVKELKNILINGRIQKINHINKNLVIFNVYSDKNYKLLISIDSQAPRIHITQKDYTNPSVPSNFTMVLRKHLNNSRIIDIKQVRLDRTVEFTIDSRNEMGMKVERKLVVDLMGKHSNLVLINENNVVIEAIKRVSHDMSRVRAVYPGSHFENISSDKMNILEQVNDLDSIEIDDNTSIFKIFYMNYEGFSPIIGREICYRSDLEPKRNYGSLSSQEKEKLNLKFLEIVDLIRDCKFNPNLIYINDKLSSFYCFELFHLGSNISTKDTISEVIDEYYLLNTNDDSLNQSKNNLLSNIKKIIDKKSNKLDYMKSDLENAKTFDEFRIEGELLSANIHKLSRGMKSIDLLNYYTNETNTIFLDEKKDGWQNVEKKYKESKKLKKSYTLLNKYIPLLKEEIDYLLDITRQLSDIKSMQELTEIKTELHEEGYIKNTLKKHNKKPQEASKPQKFETFDGSIIFVGKNNKQNEQLTLRDASKEDLFFHVKDLPGSHVILKNDGNIFSDNDIKIAAFLAAKHSKYSEENYLDVDYTERKNVFKNKGAKPGMVYYNNFKTMRVNLKEDLSELYRQC